MTMPNIYELIRMLPADIVHFHIIPYTYMPQSSTLLSDIKNFVETKKTISEIYYNKNEYLLQYEKHADKEWLVNDVLLFIKLNKSRDIYRHICYLYNDYIFTKKDIHSQFNLFWGTLSTNHRDMFVKIRTPKSKKPLF